MNRVYALHGLAISAHDYYLRYRWSIRAAKCRREAWEWGRPSDLVAGDLEFLYGLQLGCCAYCGKIDSDEELLGIDHIIPFSHLGSNTLANIVISCFRCNREKHHRDAEDYIIWLEAKDPVRASLVRERFSTIKQLVAQVLG